MPYGHYRFTVRYGTPANRTAVRFCLHVDCEVIPRPQ